MRFFEMLDCYFDVINILLTKSSLGCLDKIKYFWIEILAHNQ